MNKRILTCFLGGILSLSLIGCQQKPATPPPDILTTTGMIGDAAKQIAGPELSAIALMGSGVDPHTYKATAGDVQRIKDAKLILYNGLHLEAKLTDVLAELKKPTVALGEKLPSEDLRHLENFPGQHDPHIWFDVQLWSKAVGEIGKAIATLDAPRASLYKTRTEAYQDELAALDMYVRKRVQEIPTSGRVLVTAHDAFGYFGRAYGFEVVGLQGVSTASEAGTKDVQTLAALIASRKIKAIFVESSVPRRHIQAVQQAVKAKGWDVKIGGELFSDAMGAPGTPEGTYIGMVKHNIDTIVHALAPGERP